MPRKTTDVPPFRVHKHTKQGYVNLNGKRVYLGRADRPEARERYDRTVAEWLDDHRQIPLPQIEITIAEMVAACWDDLEESYPKGVPDHARHLVRAAAQPLVSLYGSTPAAEFSPLRLKALQQRWIDAGLTRKTVNAYVRRVRHVFKIAVSNNLVPETVHRTLGTVEELPWGRTKAKEKGRVLPVPDEYVDACLPFLSRPLRAAVELQRLTGMRPGEVLTMRPCDIDTYSGGGIWALSCMAVHNTNSNRPVRDPAVGVPR